MNWILLVRLAGALHLVTVALACMTPIPRDWDDNLRRLSDVHRRFAVAQNVYIGATMAFAGLVSLVFAPSLASGQPLARMVCGGIALWWGGRLLLLGWLRIRSELTTTLLRIGFGFLHVECAAFAFGYGWLSLRR